MIRLPYFIFIGVLYWPLSPAVQAGAGTLVEDLTAQVDPAQVHRVQGRVIPSEAGWASEPGRMLARDAEARLRAANLRENRSWSGLKTRADWESFRDRRVRALQDSLGRELVNPALRTILATRKCTGDGYTIENLVFESRPGLVVTANLYVPARPPGRMPGILIAHSHHNPKTQGELQDMGMTWARQGCLVLIMDMVGHGEQRQHPFRSQEHYARPFRVGRQDYFFRYVVGLQLQLVGESLMGWMVSDLRRGLDVLLSRPGVDLDRIILLGSVAGGGDPAAVTAALDSRVRAVIPFNFGGPQPDYEIPAAAERDFYYFGVPEWESSRCLRLGARDGFAHWVILGSVAPRHVVYAHEFAWDQARDPVWPRLQRVFDWYNAALHLAVVTGRGTVRGSPPASSHCNNVGALQRSRIYPILRRWFDMPVPDEYSRRRAPEELICLTPEAIRQFRPRPVHELARELAGKEAVLVRKRLAGLSPHERRRWLRQHWARILGDVEPRGDPRVLHQKKQPGPPLSVECVALETEPGMVVPLVLLAPSSAAGAPLPVTLGLAQEGKQALLEKRSEFIAEMLNGHSAVCLVDLRGTGETRPSGDSRRYNGRMTGLSATEWLLGQTLVGSRLRDLRSVLRYLRSRADIDEKRIALWGDSFAPSNPRDRDIAVPMDAEPFPAQAEPLGGLMGLFGALFENDVRAVYSRGGLIGYDSLLEGPFCNVPHDAVVPGALALGDLCDVAAALAPCALRLEGMVDGLNRAAPVKSLTETFATARETYRSSRVPSALELGAGEAPAREVARWLLQRLRSD